MIATVNYHSSILLSRCQSTWTNTLPRHFCRGPASHKPFDFLPSFYPFYMFLAAKTFSVHRRVHNHCTKRILNLILNRKKLLRRRNETLGGGAKVRARGFGVFAEGSPRRSLRTPPTTRGNSQTVRSKLPNARPCRGRRDGYDRMLSSCADASGLPAVKCQWPLPCHPESV